MELIKNSYLIWRGASLWNGEEIAVIVTGLTLPSSNRKTGVMLQTWILPVSTKPTESVKNGADEAVCGNCQLRGKTCYVNLVSVNNIYENIDKMPFISDWVLEYIKQSGIGLRLGSYGDPIMAPFEAWQPLIKAARFTLGYTHQWRWCDGRWRDLLQASVESIEDKNEANMLGWSTFRIKAKDDSRVADNEMICRNQKNSFIKCSSCRLCNGSKNIVVDVHGAAFKLNNFKKLQNENKSLLRSQP